MQPPPSRNAPCPCGSGRRFKECHGALAPAAATDLSTASSRGAGAPLADVHPVLETALAHQQAGRFDEAEAAYRSVLEQVPAHFDALHMLGVVRYAQGAADDAADLIVRALDVDPRHAPAHLNLALARIAQHRLDDALASLDRALALDSSLVEAMHSRGSVLAARKHHAEAVACFDRVLAVRPADADALSNRANALLEARRFDEAARDFAALVDLRPDYPYALGNLVHCQRHLADWRDLEAREARVIERAQRGEPVVTPLPLLSITGSASTQLACARAFAHRWFPPVAGAVPAVAQDDARLRIAYVSADFRDHAVTLLISGLIERHDRTRFEIIGVAFGPRDDGPARRRLAAAFDRFIDVEGETDDAVAARLRDLGVDIAVDLMGYTAASRTGIFAHRAAPIQVAWLGFPATCGATYIDYLIADAFVVPPPMRDRYTEQIAWLPDTFQVNDDQRPAAAAAPTRAQCGLPAAGFVFCCFCAVYKIGPALFDTWMRLLVEISGSVLWLVVEHADARERVRARARAHGIDAARVVFAPRVPYPEHLARLPLADLFLDTLPFNAGTTASDALWMGLPVLTCAGEAFAARMAGSLLFALGLAELVTHDLAAYEAQARSLATDAGALAALRARLRAARATGALFDTDRFRRHLELAYATMVQRQRRGEPPAGFAVPP